MSTPTSYTPGGLYSTNVNRSKTKKWANAPPVDYGGDDWGDEYEDEPSPPPKPTGGLRQRVQPLQGVDNSKKSYGNLQDPRSFSSNMSSITSPLRKKNSFDRGDDMRSLSSSAAMNTPITESRGPPLQISTQQKSVTGLRKPMQSQLPSVDAPTRPSLAPSDGRPDSQSDLTPQTTTSGYSDDIQTRRDYSPSAVPAPLSAMSPRGTSVDPPSTAHFPPRKSSLSQRSHPDFSNRPPPPPLDAALWNETGSSSSGVTARPLNSPQASSNSKPWGDVRAGSPVQERKSEYGFDGFKPPHSRDTSDATITSVAEKIDDRSPELPNFNRVSGFGDDFFSNKDLQNTDSSGPSRAKEPTHVPHDATVTSGRPSLHKEPSLGFRTAVNTAFADANSVPPTPSSRLGDSIGRSDSESTGTTGISPIMSRAPSGATAAEARSRDAGVREVNTPAIAEVIEPDSRRQSADVEKTPLPDSLKDGLEGDALTPPSRPRAERAESSFRPSLPGGWNSYATDTSASNRASESMGYQDTQDSEDTPTDEVMASVGDHPSSQLDKALNRKSANSPISSLPEDYDEDIPPPTPLKLKTDTSLSMESRPSDDETDRLRKEIVKSLTPKNSDMGQNSVALGTEKELPEPGRDARESYYLPSVYDDYWDEQDGSPTEHGPVVPSSQRPQPPSDGMAVIPPLAARRVSKSPESQPTAERRFSWEADGEKVDTKPTEPSDLHVHSPVVQPPTPTAVSDISREGSTKGSGGANPTAASSPSEIRPESSIDESHTFVNESHIGEAALATGGLATAAIYATKYATSDKSPTALSINEDSPVHPLSSSPVYPMGQSPETSSQTASLRRTSTTEQSDRKASVSHTQRLSLLPSIGTGAFTTNTTLKEIFKLPNPYDRIRACEEVQTKLFTSESGLSEWLVGIKAVDPEFADLDGNYGGPVPFVAPAPRSKFAKALNPVSATLQQPYYQQYLNASSPTSPQPTSPRPAGASGGYAPSSSPSGFSGGGSKLTTQQVQAKSKEFLHTAGVFGGKGMKAGKGLLAKGKSRFGNKGAGGGADKVD